MDVDTDDDLLQRLAAGGAMDYAAWPRLLCTIVTRIESIAQNDFPPVPMPRPSQRPAPSLRMDRALHDKAAAAKEARGDDASDRRPARQEEEMDKENTKPAPAADNVKMTDRPSSEADTPASGTDNDDEPMTDSTGPGATPSSSSSPPPPPPPRPRLLQLAATSSSSPPPRDHADAADAADGRLPPPVAELLNEIITTLTTAFARYPPYTIQRLAELVLQPRQHYRSLPTYLHAVNRVVSVTSGSNVYPLPPAVADMDAMNRLVYGPAGAQPGSSVSATNGGGSGGGGDSPSGALMNVGSDEALGGALLTPIPWLRGQTTSSSAGGSSDDMDDGGSGSGLGGDDGLGLVAAAGDGDGGASTMEHTNTNTNTNNSLDLASDAGSSPPGGSDDGSVNSDGLVFSTAGSVSNGSVGGGGGGGYTGLLPSALGGQLPLAPGISAAAPSPSPSSGAAAAAATSTQPQPQPQPQPSAQQPTAAAQAALAAQPPRRMEVRTEATETIDGPNGVGSIETVTVSVNGVPSHGAMLAAMLQQQQQRGITQGELLRQEQKAGVVPVSQLARRAAAAAAASAAAAANGGGGGGGSEQWYGPEGGELDEPFAEPGYEGDDGLEAYTDEPGPANRGGNAAAPREGPGPAQTAGGGDGDGNSDDDEDAVPHARGPREIGAVDMGPQRSAAVSGAGDDSALLTGSAADGRPRVALENIGGTEAAVGRKADALPAGLVAGALVPAAATAADKAEPPVAHQARRAGTPKREAEPGPDLAEPAKKKRKDEGAGEGPAS